MRNLVLLSGLFLVLLTACKKEKDYDASPQLRADVATIKAYIETHHLIATLDSATGIYYNVTAPGNGVDSVKYFGTEIDALYTGRLMADSTVFDSTTLNNTPRPFTYGGLITGWQFGVTKITKGGKITLYLPSYYGYGRQALPGIPANSILIFDIEMTDVKNPL